ncbi:trypsin-like peptidase domain-containing protein [Ornithinimicrobium sp. W1679]|uniref:trypsin-like peptidase domain-containing protein n=1 Tax=Ornithinimicrobium sp. W1679 TaxID=3418770 RepID=UPI003CE79E08
MTSYGPGQHDGWGATGPWDGSVQEDESGGQDGGRGDARSDRGGPPAWVLILVGALLAVLVGGGGLVLGLGLGGDDGGAAAPDPAPVPVAATVEPAASTATPTDGSNDGEQDEDDDLANDELAERYGDSVLQVEAEGCGVEGSGSAWVLDERHLVTNWHVVSVDPEPEVVSRDGDRRWSGTVVGGGSDPDVAVIRVDEDLPDALDWADTDDLREGQDIVSLGFPAPEGDFAVTPSTILSFQMAGGTREAIRGDGALDYGNSGGPALTRDGEVAGVATAMVRESNQLQMVPLLFTTDALRPTVEQILADPGAVEPECDPVYASLPDEWAPDFEGWSSEGPQSYGDDTELDALQDRCEAGDLDACDDLWAASPWGSDYEAVGNSCGGTTDEPAYGSCRLQSDWAEQDAQWERDQAEAEAEREQAEEARRAQEQAEADAERAAEEQARAEADAALAALLSACQGRDMQACDDLQWEAEYGSAAYQVAESCGGFYPDGWSSCVDREAGAAELQTLVGSCQAGDMQACDDLWFAAPSGSVEEQLGADCGGFYPGQGPGCVWAEEDAALSP